MVVYGSREVDGTPVTHGWAVSALLDAMHLLVAVAVIKCPVHQKTDSLIATGNNLADEAAKLYTSGNRHQHGPVTVCSRL